MRLSRILPVCLLMLAGSVHADGAWESIAKRLGWQGGADNRCHGAFVDQAQADYFEQMVTDMQTATPKEGEVKSHGGVLFAWPNLSVQANQASANWLQHQGLLDDVVWRWQTGFWGWAKRLAYQKDNTARIDQSGFSVCRPSNPTWWWTASRINLLSDKGVSRLWNALFYVKGVPVFYLPFVQIPIDNKSHTGLFLPQWGGDNHMGSWIGWPFYLSLSDALDVRFMPRYAKRSGWVYSGVVRWYTRFVQTHFSSVWSRDQAWSHTQAVANDKYGSNSTYDALLAKINGQGDWRYGWRVLQQGQLPGWLDWRIDWNRVSDDWVSLHFPGQFDFFDSRRVAQYVHLHSAIWGGQWAITWMRMQTFRWFDQPEFPHVYARWPSIDWDQDWTVGALGFLHMHGNFTRFVGNDVATLPIAQAHRWLWHPHLDHPFAWLGGWGQVTLGLHGVSSWASDDHDAQSVPYVQAWHHWQWQMPWRDGRKQWLSSIGYLYIPYRDQSSMPRLEVEVPTWVGNTFYQVNRFAGEDVWGDAHEVRLRLEHQWLHEDNTGWSAALQQDIAIERHHTFDLPGAQTDPLVAHSFAPLLMELGYQSPKHWNWQARVGYDSTQPQMATLQSHYQYDTERSHLSAFYTRLLEQPDDTVGSGVYQSTVGAKWQYDWSDHWSWTWATYGHSRPGFHWSHQGQLHYKQCCWGLKVGYTQQSGDGTGVQNSNYLRSFSITLSTEGL